METETELLALGGVEVRRINPAIYVREDEWQGYLEFNEVRPVIHLLAPSSPANLTIAHESVLHAQARTVRRASFAIFLLSRVRPLPPHTGLRFPNLG